MTRSWRGATAASLLLLLACGPAPEGAVESGGVARVPRLGIVLVVDQLRADRLDPGLPGGLGRLAREGRVFAQASLGHALSETCPGHVALATGRHPGPIGVPANANLDATTGTPVYCVEDSSETSGVLGEEDVGRSPRRIRADALGDWLQRAQPEARVFSVAGKDRSAIAMGGQAPSGVFWSARSAPGFTSSRYYTASLPEWVATRSSALERGLPSQWIHALARAEWPRVGERERPDDYAAESPRLGRTSGHPVRADDAAQTAAQLYVSPMLDEALLDLAEELIDRERLGSDETPDLLWVGLSATDTIGHTYGPESHEAADALRRLDRRLDSWLARLESKVGRDNLVVALSADHGVLPLPEWLEETGRGTCPRRPARVPLRAVTDPVEALLDRRFGASPDKQPWLRLSGAQLAIDRERAERSGTSLDEIVATARETLDREPSIARTWTPAEVRASESDEARLYARSIDPESAPDLLVQVAEGCLLTPYPEGTTHGSLHAYDRRVPLVIWGAGIAAGSDESPVETVDLAPTLAGLLGLSEPQIEGPPLDGRPLPLR